MANILKEKIKQRAFRRYITTSYEVDMGLFTTVWRKFWLVVLLLFVFCLPLFVGEHIVYIANLVGIFVIGAIGLNLLTGYTGQISLGHAAFLAIGAYSTAIIGNMVDLPFFLLIPLAGLISGLIGTAVALPALRLKHLYLAMVTFAFYFIVEYILFNWASVTGGSSGLSVPAPAVGSWKIRGDTMFYYLILATTILCVYFAVNLARSKIGRAFGAIRDRDIAAEVIGVSLTKYKIQAYFISSFYAGVAGSLYGMYLGYISPEHFSFIMSIQFLAMILVGGMGTITGSIFGAIFLVLMPELLRYIVGELRNTYPALAQQFGDVEVIFYGMIIILTLIFAPKGLYGLWDDVKTYVQRWPFSY